MYLKGQGGIRMNQKKEAPRRIVCISLPPELLERLDAYRWPQRLTRSGAVQDALKGYLDPEKEMRQ